MSSYKDNSQVKSPEKQNVYAILTVSNYVTTYGVIIQQ